MLVDEWNGREEQIENIIYSIKWYSELVTSLKTRTLTLAEP